MIAALAPARAVTAADPLRHEILTPEGVPLRFEVGAAGARLGAFLLDQILALAAIFCLSCVAAILGRWAAGPITVIAFLVQNFYFTWFEVRWRGQTPGKKRADLRVIDARGGTLRSGALVARNLTRNVEFWLPLQLALQPRALVTHAPGWLWVAAVGWVVVLALLPLFNRHRARLGDLIAGTVVVRSPRTYLLADVGRASGAGPGAGSPAHVFRPDQLAIYGIHELQVLEGLLRDSGPDRLPVFRAVAERIKTKIGWDRERWDVQPYRFLMDFYAAQRQRLEQDMLLGRRREFKRTDDRRDSRGRD